MVKNNKNSFTLIEILIVSSIIVVLSGTSIAIFSTYRSDKVLEGQVNLFTNVLELAKTKAGAGDTSFCSNSSNAHISGYSVTVNSTTIELTPGCDTAPTPQSYAIATNIEYSPPIFTVRFDARNYQGAEETYILKNSTDPTRCKFVKIEETGLITNGDIACP